MFEATEILKQLIAEANTRQISELDTRALLIDKYLEALDYRGLSDVRRGSPVDSGTCPDYVLYLNGEPAIGLEAKRLGAPLGPKEAAQAVAYCSGLGVRWAALTDGRYLKVYDAPLPGMLPHEREILSIDLAAYEGRDEFDALIWPYVELVAKSQLQSGMGLERWVARESARGLLTTPISRTVRTLRKELDETKGIKLAREDLSRIVDDLVG